MVPGNNETDTFECPEYEEPDFEIKFNLTNEFGQIVLGLGEDVYCAGVDKLSKRQRVKPIGLGCVL